MWCGAVSAVVLLSGFKHLALHVTDNARAVVGRAMDPGKYLLYGGSTG